jgi:hypothetical protein
MEVKNSIVGFIDLLGTKSSAQVSDKRFEEMLFYFYQALVTYLGVDQSPHCRAKIFSDCAYFYIDDFDEEYAKKLSNMRNHLFSIKHFFKCAIVQGSYEEADAAKMHFNGGDTSSAGKFMNRFLEDFLEDYMDKKDNDTKEFFWQHFSLVHFGKDSTEAYFHHEEFKGMGYSVLPDVISHIDKKTIFVESYFPSSANPIGYKKFFDIRYPKESCITVYYFNDEQRNKEFRDRLSALYKERQEVNPERVNGTKFHEDSIGFIRGVIESMYLASLKKKEYAQYYCSILNSLIVTSNFSLLHYIEEDVVSNQSWALFPEVFYELMLQKEVLVKLCAIETFELVLLVLMKEISSEMIRREKIVKEKNQENYSDISRNAEATMRALMKVLVERVTDLPAIINGRYSDILSPTEKSYLHATLAYVSGPYMQSEL